MDAKQFVREKKYFIHNQENCRPENSIIPMTLPTEQTLTVEEYVALNILV